MRPFGITLESFLAYEGTLEAYMTRVDVEKHEMASVMGICAGLMGPKIESVQKVFGFYSILEGVKTGPRAPAERTTERSEASRRLARALSGLSLIHI